MGFKGAIFDMDGVVTTTVPLHFKAWKTIELELSPNLQKSLDKGRSLPLKILLTKDSDNKFQVSGNALIYLALMIWSVIWVSIILLKAFA